MVKLKVSKTFADKETYKMYAVGEIISLPDVRAKDAIKKGLAVEVAEKVEVKAEAKPTKKPAKKSVKKG